VIASSKTRPFPVCVAVVDYLNFARHVRSAPIQVLASTTLPKIVDLLFETRRATRFRAHHSPTISSIGTSVPEQHPSMTSTFKHLKSQSMCPSAKMLGGFSITPTMQTIVVDCISIADPKLASIIGDNAEAVVAGPSDFQGT
jgi:hypothetical protein